MKSLLTITILLCSFVTFSNFTVIHSAKNSKNNLELTLDNSTAEMLEKLIKEKKLTTIRISTRDHNGYTYRDYETSSFPGNNWITLKNEGFNLSLLLSYEWKVVVKRNASMRRLNLYF
ncbi:MAG: hypothetical protein COA58_15245 [Bacteroidetes bacterium]|nr:MAG: hypothetical protein COA58_15245 [Bacteroidota bacterium]